MERFSLELEATEVFYGKTKVVGLVEMSRLVQVHQRASHVLPPSATALCAGLWARTLMTTRYLPAVDVHRGGERGGGAAVSAADFYAFQQRQERRAAARRHRLGGDPARPDAT